MADQNAPTGYKVSAEQKAGEEAGLDLRPSGAKATKIRKEVRTFFIALGTIIVLAIVAGVLSRGKRNDEKANQPEAGKPVQSAGAVGGKGVDDLQEQAVRDRAAARQRQLEAQNGGIPNAPDSITVPNPNASIPSGDPARDLNLPPTQYRPVNGAGAPNGGQSGPRQLTPAEERAAAERADELAARKSPLGKGSGGGLSSAAAGLAGGAGGQPLNALDLLSRDLGARNAALAAAGGAAGGGAGTGGGAGASQDDQNMQGDKASFLSNSRKPGENPTVAVSRTRSLTHYEIQAGWDIPATLEQAINSDLPGEVRGVVRENVYDTASGKFLLIPQGSRVIGSYNSRVAYGQNGIQVVWSRLIYPDGSSIDLGGLNGQDVRGLSGFRDKVDNHYARLLGFALLTSGFAAGVELASNQNQNNQQYGYITPSQAVSQAVSQQVGQLGTEITRRNLNIQPTVKIGIGYRFTIRVRKDLIFDQPYREQAPLYAR